MTVFCKTLFKRHSNGSVGSWTVEVIDTNDGCAILNSKSVKVIGGAEVITPRRYSRGKNIGRANETTPLEQAIAEAKSKVSKKRDGGYVDQPPEAGAVATNSLGFIKPMLAKPIEDVKGWDFPMDGQTKLDGHRMLATVKDGKVVLYSRAGKPFKRLPL